MRIKTKLTFGVGFLFAVIVLLGVLGTFYINKLSQDSTAILTDNYESLEYTQNMSAALDSSGEQALVDFEHELNLQEGNITEEGEERLTERLRRHFETLEGEPGDTATIKVIRSVLHDIEKLNMRAIIQKNEVAQKTAESAVLYIGVIAAICILITFTFIVNFPRYIANPIQELTESIKGIANKNYDERLHFRSGDEFGELADAFNVMAGKLDEYENSNLARILFEKKRIETIINKMIDPIIGLDEMKRILFANLEAVRVLGADSHDIIGKYAPDVAVKNDLLRHLMQDLMDHSDNSQQPVKIFLDGKESYFMKDILTVTTMPSGEKKATLAGHVIILRNVTPFKELDLAKTNFIATISHELKTPIASIQMCSRLLSDSRVGSLNSEQTEILKTVDEELGRLMKITGELLNLAQVETGNIRLQFQSILPIEIIDYAHKALKFQAEQKQLEIETRCPADLPAIRADLDKTAWVMVNLLSNAIRYSPEGGKVIIEAVQSDGTVVFSVQDFGRGIDPSYKDKVFDKFYRVPGSDPSGSGTGLGLAISKDFILSEGGKIWVESQMGEGTRFSFELKAVETEAAS